MRQTMKPNQKPFVDTIEENFIAITLGLMTLITFANVVVRYVFQAAWFRPITDTLGLPTNILWGLEVTVFLFAWLVLIGASYGVKKNFHIGVDVLVNALPVGARKPVTIAAAAACLAFAILLFIGAWNYWAPFAGIRPFPALYNDLIASPLGLSEIEYRWRSQSFYETDDVPVPFFLTWIKDVFNEGEAYEKLPRFIPYLALPIGMGLLVFRLVQAFGRILRGEQSMIIASHEAEELMEEVEARNRAEGASD